MVVIVDIVNTQRVLVDGMGSFPRVVFPLARLTLTKIVVPILRGARTGTLTKVAGKFGLQEKWIATAVQQKLDKF